MKQKERLNLGKQARKLDSHEVHADLSCRLHQTHIKLNAYSNGTEAMLRCQFKVPNYRVHNRRRHIPPMMSPC